MRSLSGPIWDLWNAGGPFVGKNRAHGRVTVEFGAMLNESAGPVGDYPADKLPIRWFQRLDNSQIETELPNVQSISISRSIDTDAATCDVSVYNTSMLPAQLAELGNPGWFTPGRGSHPDSDTRWGHTANEWSTELTPNALLRTYEGWGGYNDDGTPMSIEDALAGGYIVQTGTWLIDEITPDTSGMLKIKCRDPGKLLIEQPIYPPLVPAGKYPLRYSRFFYREADTPMVLYGNSMNGIRLIIGIEPTIGSDGYWLAGDDGGIFTYGNNWFFGSLGGLIDHGLIGMARTASGDGYWIATEDGSVFRFGDAMEHGFNAPATGELMIAIEPLQIGDGYYMVDTGGDVYSFGDAAYHGGGPGSTPSSIVGMATLPDGSGYWLLDDTGHVYAYGAATYLGNGDPGVGSSYTAIAVTPTGNGYYLVTQKGHVYTFGDAVYHGGTAGITLNDPVSDIAVAPNGKGYWLVAEDGGVFTFGDIQFYGSLPAAFYNTFAYDGNYYDYTDIVRDLLLWAGFWAYDGGIEPGVFGSLEQTGIPDLAPAIAGIDYAMPEQMFIKKAVIAPLTEIKEMVGFLLWFDSIGAVHFESPNWWNEGNNLPDGSRTLVLPEIDERVQLINYGINQTDKTARDRVIIANADPTAGMTGTVVTTVVPETAAVLRGQKRPALWGNPIMTDPKEQQTMADLLARQLLFQMRPGSVVCVANPLLEINDQARIWERITDEVYDHYIRGIDSTNDLDAGQYTMRLTTHWLGRDWGGVGPNRNALAGSALSGENFGLPAIDVGPVTVDIGSIASAEAAGLVTVS